MAIRPDYQTGTIDLVASSADFTTTGAALQMVAVQPGDAIITPSGHVLIIATITGQNSGTLFLPCPPAAAGTGLALRIRFQPDGSRYQGAVRNLIDLLSSGNVEALAGLAGEAGKVPVFTGPGAMALQDYLADPNGSLGKLAALTLAARQILQTDENGDLKQIALAANKFLRTDTNGDLALSDLGAAAIALLNLSGTAAADRLPYLTGTGGADLTVMTGFARGILDDANGDAVWGTIGGSQNLGNTGYSQLPGGFMIQKGTTVVTSNGAGAFSFAFPASYFNDEHITIMTNGDYQVSGLINPSIIPSALATSGVNALLLNSATGGVMTNQVARINWISVGRWK